MYSNFLKHFQKDQTNILQHIFITKQFKVLHHIRKLLAKLLYYLNFT